MMNFGEVHLATLDVLLECWCKVERRSERNFLQESGCTVDEDSHIVKIPAFLVEDAIAALPQLSRLRQRS